MKLRNIISAAMLIGGIAATSAQAANYNLTEMLNYSGNGFGSSLIHDQTSGVMNGNTVARFDSTLTSGTFNNGVINFAGSISNGADTSTFTASGALSESTRTNGLFGSITFSFLGDLLNNVSLQFDFADQNFTSGQEPNGYASNSTHNFIALWGDTGRFASQPCDQGVCYGMDLRIAYEPGGGGTGVVPLPASLGFLLAGIGGLGVTRKLRKKV